MELAYDKERGLPAMSVVCISLLFVTYIVSSGTGMPDFVHYTKIV
jgi:hypothetical protein